MDDFLERYGPSWDVHWDTRSDRPNIISGQGIPFIPGPGNALTLDALKLNGESITILDKVIVTELAFEFIESNNEVFRADLSGLHVNEIATRTFGENNRLWFIHYDQYHKGVRVKDRI